MPVAIDVPDVPGDPAGMRALAAGELPNPRVVTKTRREIALIMTVLSEKSLETSKGDA